MAFEIRILAEVRNLNPVSEDGFSLAGDDAGVLIRCDKSATIAVDTDASLSDVFVLSAAQAAAMGDEVLTEVKTQLGIVERNARREETT
jgi:hypothetical protein